MKSVKKVFSAALLCVAALGASASETAHFDMATGTLTMPVLQLDAGVRYRDVVIRLLDLGRLQMNDPAVGTGIQFVTSGNVLRLPKVVVGGVTYPQVSLVNPELVLVSVGELVVDSGAGGQYQLDIQVTAAGVSVPPITITNVPKPATQNEFCGDPGLQQTITQSAAGIVGTWTMTGCTFNGSSGRIDMVLNAGFMSVPYSATYTFR